MYKKWVLFSLFILLMSIFLSSDLSQFLTFHFLNSKHQELFLYYQSQPLLSIAIFCATYIGMSVLCIPGTYILTILSGAIFGLTVGTLASSFSSSIGALIAFSASRWIFKDYVQTRFAKYIKPFNKGIENDGPVYLFMLRLTPLVPFFAINFVMGILPISTRVFYIVTQLGMLVPTFLYVNAGTQLVSVQDIEDIFTAKIIISLLALALLPLVIKRTLLFRKRLKPNTP
jgi:uncharacterized membrane protein YdjX (TVP38/TMEM64 family)